MLRLSPYVAGHLQGDVRDRSQGLSLRIGRFLLLFDKSLRRQGHALEGIRRLSPKNQYWSQRGRIGADGTI